MALEIITVPCLSDNYAYLVRDESADTVALVDAPEAGPIEAALEARGWRLDAILITHHHDDHIAGVERLRTRTGAKVIGAAADRARLPPLDRAVVEGDTGGAGGLAARVLEVPGHTSGHVAYHFAEAGALFSADSLMVMGCGRLFEGAASEMWASLAKLAALPDDTMIYSGHEYTAVNMRFALSLDPGNPTLADRAREIGEARAAARPTVPAQLALERRTNPFLRAADPDMKALLGMTDQPDVEVFADIRRRKDRF